MRNVWKGLIVGGLTGVGAGIVLDGLNGASRQAREVGRAVARRAPVVADRMSEIPARAEELIEATTARVGNDS